MFIKLKGKAEKWSASVWYTVILLNFIGLLLTGGCQAGDGTGILIRDDESVNGDSNAAFSWIQTNVWGKICITCHKGLDAPMELSWEETKSCNNVGKQSRENNSLSIISAGDPDNSYMIWKVQGQGPNGEAIEGGRMPLNLDPLPDETIQNMRDWISDGAVCP